MSGFSSRRAAMAMMLSAALMPLAAPAFARKRRAQPRIAPATLMVVATLHELHEVNPRFGYDDLYRLIAKKTSRGADTVRQALSKHLQAMNSAKLMTLAQELLVARQIATAMRQASRRTAPTEEVTT